MGWGKKTEGAKPQPKRQDLTPEITQAVLGTNAPFYSGQGKSRPSDDEPIDIAEKPSAAAKAQLEWHKLKSKRGWTDASLLMLLYEFIKSRGLFADLIKFAGRR